MAIHVLQTKLIASDGDKCIIERRFRMMWHIHNETAKYAIRQMHKLQRDRVYIDAKRAYAPLKKQLDKLLSAKNPDTKKISALKKEIRVYTEILNDRIDFFCLTANDLEKYAKVMQHTFKNHLSSNQVQKEADRVYKGVEKVLYEGAEYVHLKKLVD